MTFAAFVGLFMSGCKLLHNDSVRPYAAHTTKKCYFAMMPWHHYCDQAVVWSLFTSNFENIKSYFARQVHSKLSPFLAALPQMVAFLAIGSSFHDNIFSAAVGASVGGFSVTNKSYFPFKNCGQLRVGAACLDSHRHGSFADTAAWPIFEFTHCLGPGSFCYGLDQGPLSWQSTVAWFCARSTGAFGYDCVAFVIVAGRNGRIALVDHAAFDFTGLAACDFNVAVGVG